MRLQFDLWLHLARTDKIALGKLLLVSGLSREFLSAFDQNTIDGIIQSFVAMSDWPLIELITDTDTDKNLLCARPIVLSAARVSYGTKLAGSWTGRTRPKNGPKKSMQRTGTAMNVCAECKAVLALPVIAHVVDLGGEENDAVSGR